jgi:hypothetical protein
LIDTPSANAAVEPPAEPVPCSAVLGGAAAGSPSENHIDPAHHEGQLLARQFPDTLTQTLPIQCDDLRRVRDGVELYHSLRSSTRRAAADTNLSVGSFSRSTIAVHGIRYLVRPMAGKVLGQRLRVELAAGTAPNLRLGYFMSMLRSGG